MVRCIRERKVAISGPNLFRGEVNKEYAAVHLGLREMAQY